MLSASLLPGVVRRAVCTRERGGTVHIANTALVLLIRRRNSVFGTGLGLPIRLARKRILRQGFRQISRLDQIIERLWGFLLVERVLGNQLAHVVQILPEYGLASTPDRFAILRYRNRKQDQQHADHDHEFEKSEPGAEELSSRTPARSKAPCELRLKARWRAPL